MSKVAFGVTSVKMGDIDPATGLPTALTDVGDIYRDTATMTEADGEVTNHFAERKTDPVVTIEEPGEETLQFSLMDISADNLVKYLGGTVTEVLDQPDVWNKPDGVVTIEKAFEITTDDGTIVTINRGRVRAKRNLTPTRNGIFLLEVTVRILAPKVDGVPAVTVTDNAV
jgi:hypothetical protein